MAKNGSGILLHITSLPSKFGIGDLGPAAYKFVDFLHSSKQKYWQILPLNPTDPMFGNCPYSSISAFAVNPILISPELMQKEGWLNSEDLKNIPGFSDETVDYNNVTLYKNKLFDIAFKRFKERKNGYDKYQMFCKEHAGWLDHFALFVVIKTHLYQKPWNEWNHEVRDMKKKALDDIRKKHFEEIEKVKFIQYVFIKQWFELKDYCKKRGVKIIGDIPIYVSFDSVDVWTNPQIFKLNDDKSPTFVSGVPPDYFSATGQRWGNPVYNWDKLREIKYAWWIWRLKHNLHFFDMVRIDHFRGLIAYWEIPSHETTAINGTWQRVPSDDFLSTVCKKFPDSSIIAEDLGIITPDVEEAIDKFGFPGMKVLLFAFNGDINTHPYLPHNYKKRCIVYTGTHDNNTVQGWFKNEASENEKKNFYAYINEQIPDDEVHWGFIELALSSKAEIAIIPMQDILGLDEKCRMNIPGTMDGNWQWRLLPSEINKDIIEALSELIKATGRN